MVGAGTSSLQVRLLGELEVVRNGRAVALPQSKKTRALLAYLVLTERQHRREHLCSLLWDVADDPRGALRWSLSKLRAIADDDHNRRRIVADRERVAFDAQGAEIDALALRRALTAKPIADVPTDALEGLATAFRGELLEGLDLADFDDYQAWCVGERERARSLRALVLAELVQRVRSRPERAVEHAAAWARIDPMNETARASLVRLLGVLGRRDEARQHYESGRRLDKELGRSARGELDAAWREIDERPSGAVTPATRPASAPTPPIVPCPAASTGPPMLGRERELAALDALAAEVTRAESLAVRMVTGEAGVGKTRLLSEWMRHVRAGGGVVLHGTSFEAETGNPYAPWIDALGAATDGDPFAAESGGASTRDRLFARVSEIVSGVAARGRILALVFDDVQWLDEGSAELLHFIVRTNRARPVAVVLAVREGEISDNASLLRVIRAFRRDGLLGELPVGPLGEAAIASLVRAVGSRADASRVHAQSGGNVLFALELARADAAVDDVPATLSSLVRDRIAQLPAEAADVLRWAAVLGPTTTTSSIDELSTLGIDAVVRALEQLEARSLLTRDPERDDAHVFAHDIVQRVVYGDLSEPRRRLMHKRVAVLLARRTGAGTASIADVAHHAALAHESALAAEACLASARRSLRLFASGDAYTLARRGARHAEQMQEPDRTRRLIELADVQFGARRPENVAEAAAGIGALAERALDLGCPEHARLAFHVLSYLSWETGVWADAEKHMREAERVSRGASEEECIRGIAEAARCLVLLERDLGRAQALAFEAAARGKQAGVEPAATFDALGLLALHQGRIGDARSKLEHARDLARVARDHHDEFQALEHLVVLEIENGDLRAARARAEELVVLGERFREGSEAPFARSLVALTGLALGDCGAEEALAREIDALTVADSKHRLAYLLTRVARLDVEAGRIDTARSRSERALAIGELLDRPTEIVLARIALALCARATGDRDEEDRHRRALDALPLTAVTAAARRLVEDLDG